MSKTLYDKLWDEHVVTAEGDGTATIYIDRHLMHEVTARRPLKVCVLQAQALARVLHRGDGRPQYADDRLGKGSRRHH